MFRVIAHKSAAGAKAYYAEGLKREDYYSEKQEIIGKWQGLAAERLGLLGNVTAESFAALVENRHPATGKQLTPRNKIDRIVGYDLNFHAPKSLSVVHALTGDDRIVESFRAAVAETMREIEERTATRIRKGGAQENRVTGNLIWAEFTHFTARPVSGMPDPHLHSHCFAMNLTFDVVEGKWKAAKFRDIKKHAPYHEAAFHSRLSDKIATLGYGIERTRQSWEISGVPKSVIDKFSRRTAQIEKLAAEKGITDAKQKDALGASSRVGKRRGLTQKALLQNWQARLSPGEAAMVAAAKQGSRGSPQIEVPVTAKAALDYASKKLFAKDSVVEVSRLLGEAMRYGVGGITPADAKQEFTRRGMIERRIGEDQLCTSVDVLAEEVSLINFVRTGRGIRAAFNPRYNKFADPRLSPEQRAAVKHILSSTDQVIAVRGAAGVGKTTLMIEAVAAIEGSGTQVFAFAPSADASRGTLRESGFANAETVAHLLANPKLQRQVRGQAVWIDEIGLLGIRDLWQVMQVIGANTPVILTGDSQQHAPVERGDGFRLLQQHAGLAVVEVEEIQRQQTEVYKSAVAALSKGDLPTAFQRLDKLGAIIEVTEDAERYRLLASDYLALSSKGSVPLVVSPTHAEIDLVTCAIRDAKREAGLLKADRQFTRYHNLQWEEADRARSEWYEPGIVVQFNQHAKGIRRGEIFSVTGRDADGAVKIESAFGQKTVLPLDKADRFQVYEEREIALAKGDRIRITRNGETADGRKINNGYAFTVAGFNRKGQIVLNTGAVLNPDHGHFNYGYVSTSHSSQSKSERDVLIAQSERSFAASSMAQFYVSASRGKETIRIYTDNRVGLQEAVGNTAARMAAVELAGLTRGEIASLVGVEMNAKQWRESIQSRRAEGESKNFVKNLLDARRADASHQKQSGMDWKGYIQMRRKIIGADGKSRAKVYSGSTDKKPGFTKTNQRSFIRPTSPRVVPDQTKTPEKAAKPAEARQPLANGRTARLTTALKASANNFKTVLSRGKGEQPSRPAKPTPDRQVRIDKQNTLPTQSNGVARAVAHVGRERKAEAAKQHTKPQVKTPTPVVVRRK